MNVTVFGAVDVLGRAVVETAASEGHEVTAAVPSSDAAHEAAGVGAAGTVVADPARGTGVEAAVAGADAVLLLPDRRHQSADDLAVAAARVTDAMARERVTRLVALAGAGARDRPGDRTLPLRVHDAVRGLRGASVGAERAFAGRIADSDCDWTVVRAARIAAGPGDGVFQHGYRRVGLLDAVTTGNAAAFLVTLAESDGYVGGMPIVTGKMQPKVRSSGPLAAGAPSR